MSIEPDSSAYGGNMSVGRPHGSKQSLACKNKISAFRTGKATLPDVRARIGVGVRKAWAEKRKAAEAAGCARAEAKFAHILKPGRARGCGLFDFGGNHVPRKPGDEITQAEERL
jgi:hypothetical protein